MPLKKATGNMYDWVTHTWNALIGECPHKCDYCYVSAMTKRFPDTKWMYEGKPRLNASDFVFKPYEQQNDWHEYYPHINLGKDRKIFVAHTGDLFAEGVEDIFIREILDLCIKHPFNDYVIQTKNPMRMIYFAEILNLPKANFELGTTVETDFSGMLKNHSKAPDPINRLEAMRYLKKEGYETFITIEPIMEFSSPAFFGALIVASQPTFVNIGADSKRSSLPEPTWKDVQELIEVLKKGGVPIKLKENLDRLKETH
jgi:DNA repair photolyase